MKYEVKGRKFKLTFEAEMRHREYERACGEYDMFLRTEHEYRWRGTGIIRELRKRKLIAFNFSSRGSDYKDVSLPSAVGIQCWGSTDSEFSSLVDEKKIVDMMGEKIMEKIRECDKNLTARIFGMPRLKDEELIAVGAIADRDNQVHLALQFS